MSMTLLIEMRRVGTSGIVLMVPDQIESIEENTSSKFGRHCIITTKTGRTILVKDKISEIKKQIILANSMERI